MDLFCGGATVGINMEAEQIIFIDNNPRVISLLSFLANTKLETLVNEIEKLIAEYHLTYSGKYGYQKYRRPTHDNNGFKEFNQGGFYALRERYNALVDKDSEIANTMLYVLMVYGFNNDLRFNKEGKFNLPVGKTDFNKNNLAKITEYNKVAQHKHFTFLCADYDSRATREILDTADFVYVDPPYLITDAVYNESGGWDSQKEQGLVNLLSQLDTQNVKFALSNVMTKVGVANEILQQWAVANPQFTVNPINYHYRSCSYNKINRQAREQEVLITN